ncbi:MAG TPA: FHA domain-containing protein [Beutenbergiaceae bacterium]|nr:FHA domain-containing protein [Beutenbergiaceae bacterium]
MSDLDDLRDAAHSATVFVLTMDDGKSVTVSGAGLIGRRPQPRPGEHVAHLVAVDDPGRSLSRTHAAFGIDGQDLWVEDRGSANGTVVLSATGATTRVFPGKRVAVPEDGRINLGERSVTVQRWHA